MKKNKAILSIFLILVILLVGVATIFISSKVSQEQAIAPTAPTSEPRAAETVWVGSEACTVTATSLCVASEVITCNPDCPTECGKLASTISTCKDSCGIATTKACAATTACTDDLEVTKKAYKYVGGTYAYTTEIDTVAKNQTFIYAISIENFGEIDATNVNITDTLNGEKQDQLTFVDAKSGCTYSASERKVKCDGLTVKAGEKGVYAFKVKVAGGAVNGDIIKNVAIVNAVGTDITAANELTISTVVGCDHTCTGDSECNTGLVCDTGSSKCRLATNLESDTCSAPMAARPTSTPRPTTIRTPAPTRVVGEVEITEAPLPTERPVAAAPTALPEAGILDFPGVAAFGGGLLLAIIGILLAL